MVAHEAVCAQSRVRTLNTANHGGWQRGTRLDGRDAVQVAVQQRVAGADDEAFMPGTTAEASVWHGWRARQQDHGRARRTHPGGVDGASLGLGGRACEGS
jgi:hypothetical protein